MIVGYGGAAALAAGAAVLYFTDPGRKPAAARIACAPALGVSCMLRF